MADKCNYLPAYFDVYWTHWNKQNLSHTDQNGHEDLYNLEGLL